MASPEKAAPSQGEYTPARCPIGQLHFDLKNPRLPPENRSEEEVLVFLMSTNLDGLMSSIAQQGFFPGDPLLISPLPDRPRARKAPTYSKDADYVVVEGNRRLAAVRLLRDPDTAPAKSKTVQLLASEARKLAPDELPVIIFPTRSAILDYLGFRHITGIQEWDPLEKARYLEQLKIRAEERGEPADNKDLARTIGSSGPYVGRLLAALNALRRLSSDGFFKSVKVDEEEVPFSLLSTAFNYNEIVDYLGLEEADDPGLKGLKKARLRDIARWIFVKERTVTVRGKEKQVSVLEESRNMRHLATIVGNDEAVAALKGGMSIRGAALLAWDADRIFQEAVGEAVEPMRVVADRAPKVEEPQDETIEELEEIGNSARKAIETVRPKLNGKARKR